MRMWNTTHFHDYGISLYYLTTIDLTTLLPFPENSIKQYADPDMF